MSDRLNNMLRKWSEERQPSEELLGKLADQIRVEASRRSHLSSYEDAPSFGFWQKLQFAALGAAVTLTAVFCFYYGKNSGSAGIADNDVGLLVAVTKEQRQSSARLFCEMQKVFPDRLTWVAESNGDIGLGVESLADGAAGSESSLLVRLAVVKKGPDESGWTSIWSADVMLRGEEMVEVVPNRNKDSKLALWIFPLSDGRIAVDSEIDLKLPVPMLVRGTVIVEQGEAKQLMSLSENGVEYRLLQTVTSLAEGCRGAQI